MRGEQKETNGDAKGRCDKAADTLLELLEPYYETVTLHRIKGPNGQIIEIENLFTTAQRWRESPRSLDPAWSAVALGDSPFVRCVRGVFGTIPGVAELVVGAALESSADASA